MQNETNRWSKANFVRTRIVKGKSYDLNTDVFLNFPKIWQFPLSSHDFGQVSGLIREAEK